MTNVDPVVFRELPVIQKIIADETWLEGERRRAFVSPEDPVVKEKVCNIIMRIGEELRQFLELEIAAEASAVADAKQSRAA